MSNLKFIDSAPSVSPVGIAWEDDENSEIFEKSNFDDLSESKRDSFILNYYNNVGSAIKHNRNQWIEPRRRVDDGDLSDDNDYDVESNKNESVPPIWIRRDPSPHGWNKTIT